MNWFNYYGLIIVAILLAPNVLYALCNKEKQATPPKIKWLEILEQIGRFGCCIFMVFNIPFTYFNFWFDHALTIYLSINGALSLTYLALWIICWKKSGLFKALSLSITPALIFLFSGVALANIPLIVFAIIFAVCHISISYRNESYQNKTR